MKQPQDIITEDNTAVVWEENPGEYDEHYRPADS